MNYLSDQEAREEALDPNTSFIVQAPAGSGKTELLTQRYLVLLNYVNTPEDILAITFTKKSAKEMRARIINTLKNADITNNKPTTPHAAITWKLAKNVLEKDKKLKWNLLINPNRLRIQTIDSFNATLTKHLPILSHFGATPEISTHPFALYEEAIQEFLSHLEENVTWSDAIAQLLLHLDNDLNKVHKLLVTLLSKRDQWLPHLNLSETHPEKLNRLKNYLNNIVLNHLTHLHAIFPTDIQETLIELLQFSADNLKTISPPSSLCHDDLSLWKSLVDFLLTKENAWRKTVTVKEGFPSAGKNIFLKEMKQKYIHLLNGLSTNETLRYQLETVRYLPTIEHLESQWETLKALHSVLHVAVAQLKLVFQKHGKIDYIENALAALTALGSEENPTDLALALDYRIQHILVDEFQDTSNMQYHLLRKLTAGWTPHDGRTLFVVGDPMQSIYRFREAEVGLFISARRNGLGNIPLKSLTLSTNFRSEKSIVDWVNFHFKNVFPYHEEIATGAVTYSPSIASKNTPTEISGVQLHPFIDSAFCEQADKIVEIIQNNKKNNPHEKIAILVRNRTHVKNLIPALKKSNLPYRAIKIDPLNFRPVIQDLIALTKALLNPIDSIAWLSVLRAPWCGLTLEDLLNLSEKNIPLLNKLTSNIQALSDDGKKRLDRILPILREKISERRRFSLRAWIEETWILLGGPACVEQTSDVDDAEAYFNLLDKLDVGGTLPHLEKLDSMVKQLFASPNNQADDTLQIMTIHNSKGLEFDTVIIPHLEKKTSQDDKQILLWLERTRDGGKSDLLLAPINATGEKNNVIYDYIKRQIKIKSDYEDGRLLYVAATRAKKQLHLVFSVNSHKNKNLDTELKPSAGSLLETLWPSIKNEIPFITENTIYSNHNFPKKYSDYLQRLTTEWKNPITLTKTKQNTLYQNTNEVVLPDKTPRVIGIIIHKLLQNLAEYGLDWWRNKTLQQHTNYIQKQLLQSGLLSSQIFHSTQAILQCMETVFKDPRAKWILSKQTESYSEYPITAIISNNIYSNIIDRTFIDEKGIRWIIDYKTAILSSENLDEFLIKQKNEHEEQLKIYYHTFRNREDRPIKIGLYFPLIPAWCEWEYE